MITGTYVTKGTHSYIHIYIFIHTSSLTGMPTTTNGTHATGVNLVSAHNRYIYTWYMLVTLVTPGTYPS